MKSAGKLLTGRRTRSVENVHLLRLMALLGDLVREMGTMQAAETLGVDRKTVWRGMCAGRLSPRLADAMERLLLEEGVADSARQLERIEALEGRVEEVVGDVNALREDVREAIEAVRGEIGAPEDRGAHGASKPEGRLVGLDVLRQRAIGTAARAGQMGMRQRAAMIENRREYPSLVTRESADDDQEVYGEAWPLVDEWRTLELRREVGTKLDQARTRERIMALEIEMIERRGLTLPPATAPMHPSERESYLGWRRRALDDLRRERAWLEILGRVRRVLTLGLWQD